MNIINFGEVKIKPFDGDKVLYLSLNQKVNEHTLLEFRLLLAEDKKDSYIDIINSEEKISLSVKKIEKAGDKEKEKEEVLFYGKTIYMEIERDFDGYELRGKAISYTKDMDLKLENRSFQNKDLTYEKLARDVISKYNKSDLEDHIFKSSKTGKFILQYQESDWEFLKRMASRVNAPIIPVVTRDTAAFYIGIDKESKETEINCIKYKVQKDIEKYNNLKENSIKSIMENDMIYYEVDSIEFLYVGSKVKFNGKTLFVKEAENILKKGIMENRYKLVTENGMKIAPIYNEKITGISIMGSVLSIEKDMLKLHLEVDKKQDKGTAWFFKHTTNYTGKGETGWYCMPEIGDYVRVNFPSHKEEEGVVIDSVRQTSETKAKTSDPNTTYFRTAAGREIMFNPGGILISGEDGKVYINLSSKKGISIMSNTAININSGSNITINAEKNLIIGAKEKIDIKCKESTFKMDGNAELKGNNIKAN